MKQEIEEPIEGVSIERYAGIAALLGIQGPSIAAPLAGPERAATLEAEGIDSATWERVHAAWQARIHEEIARASSMPDVPVVERYPVVMRFGAAYAMKKRSIAVQCSSAPDGATPTS